MAGGVLFVVGLAWFVTCEVVRGRPSTSSRASFVLTFASPLGAIGWMLAALAVTWL